jgi:hypothetical protein
MTKTFVVFCLAALVAVALLFFLFFDKRYSRRQVMIYLSIFLGTFALLPLLYALYKWATIPGPEYIALRDYGKFFFENFGSGIAQFKAAPVKITYLCGNIIGNYVLLRSYLGGTWPVVGLTLIVILALVGSLGASRAHFAAYGLLLAASFYLGWFFVLSPLRFVRHLSPGIVFLLVGLSLLTVLSGSETVWHKGRLRLLPAISIVILCLYSAMFVSRVDRAEILIPRSWDKEPRLIALLETARFLNAHQEQYTFVAASWWANRDLEYILPGVGNFTDYFLLTEEPLDKSWILVRSEFWNWDKNPILDELAATSDRHKLFSAPPFLVTRIDEAQ